MLLFIKICFRLATVIEKIDLSYNVALTGISLRRLLQANNLVHLVLYGCPNILKYSNELTSNDFDKNKHEVLKLTIDTEKDALDIQYLIKLWHEWHADQAVVELTSDFLSLTVKK